MRANIVQRDRWTQIRIGACALLLPLLTLGAAFYSMLPTPDEGRPRPATAAGGAQAARPELPRGTIHPWGVGTDRQPEATPPVASKPESPEDRSSATATVASQAVVAGSAATRVSDPRAVEALPSATA